MEEMTVNKKHTVQNQSAVQHAFLDPVCKMTVDQDTAAYHYSYAGITYFFCSEECLARFTKDPANFFGGDFPSLSSELQEKPLLGRPYTCPIHREIIQDCAGACFLCGAALVLMPPFS
jgi:Cu+-exporting ATPase